MKFSYEKVSSSPTPTSSLVQMKILEDERIAMFKTKQVVFKFWNAVVQISVIADAPQKSARNQMDH